MWGDEKAALDIYCKMYAEQGTQARHHDTLRATVSGLIITAIGALLAFSKFDSIGHTFGWAILVLSVLGCLLSLKHYERNRLHTRMQIAFSNEIDSILTKSGLRMSIIFEESRKNQGLFLKILNTIRLFLLWLIIFVFLGGLGFYIATR